MKLSEAPSAIVGVQLGHLEVALISDPTQTTKTGPYAEAKFGLITEGGEMNGSLTIHSYQWSERTQKALEDFVGILEEEAIKRIFKIDSESAEGVPLENKTKDNNEPAQF